MNEETNKKLDRIIELLEKQQTSKEVVYLPYQQPVPFPNQVPYVPFDKWSPHYHQYPITWC